MSFIGQQALFPPETYQRRLIMFFDILGWRNEITRAGQDPAAIGRLAAVVRMLGVSYIADDARDVDIEWSSFSDNVVVSFPVEAMERRLRNIAQTQLGLALVQFNLRGAITVGEIYHRDGVVFGPGLVRAYELESRRAVVARVILDDEVPEFQGLNCEVLVHEDGVTFIDPFIPAFIAQAHNPEAAPVHIEAYNSQFGAQLQSPVGTPPVLAMLEAVLTRLAEEIRQADDPRIWTKLAWQFDRVASHLGTPIRAVDLETGSPACVPFSEGQE